MNVLTWTQASLIFRRHLLTLCSFQHGRFVTLTICHCAFPLTLVKEIVLRRPNYKYAFSCKYRLICMDIGFCLSFPFMDLAVFWCAVSGHYPYIESSGIGRISLCFAGRDTERDWRLSVGALLSYASKPKQACPSFHFSIQSQHMCSWVHWRLNGISICWRLLTCPHKALHVVIQQCQ